MDSQPAFTEQMPVSEPSRGPALDSNHAFPRFGCLPVEMRNAIWEYTWPEALVIEVALHKANDTGFEQAYLRPTSRLSAWLKYDFGGRLISNKPFEACPNAVALHACHESRALFMQKHKVVQHPTLARCAFYFNPRTDILCLPHDVERHHLEEVQECYGAQLQAFQMILVEEMSRWIDVESFGILLPDLTMLAAIKVLLEGCEFIDFEDIADPATEDELQESATMLRQKDLQLIGGRGWVVQYVDREQKVYAEIRS